jgi:hypothetical protein
MRWATLVSLRELGRVALLRKTGHYAPLRDTAVIIWAVIIWRCQNGKCGNLR